MLGGRVGRSYRSVNAGREERTRSACPALDTDEGRVTVNGHVHAYCVATSVEFTSRFEKAYHDAGGVCQYQKNTLSAGTDTDQQAQSSRESTVYTGVRYSIKAI